jgi:hypothetical protein
MKSNKLLIAAFIPNSSLIDNFPYTEELVVPLMKSQICLHGLDIFLFFPDKILRDLSTVTSPICLS